MKLYEVKRMSQVRLLDPRFPPDYPPELVEELKKRIFTVTKVDGAYSVCYDDKGERHYPAAWTEVEVIKEGAGDLPFD